MWTWRAAQQEALTAVASLLTSVAIVVGGVWALRQYWKRRDPHPKARIRHSISHRHLDSERLWLRVELTLENCGTTLMRLSAGLTRVSRILPLLGPLPDRMEPPFRRELAWPQIGDDEKEWTTLQIEPGECDSVSYDFVLSGDVRTVLVYSHVDNQSQGTSRFGWQTTTVYEIDHDDRIAEAPDNQGTTDAEAAGAKPRQIQGRHSTAGSEAAAEATDQRQIVRQLRET